MPGPSTEAWLCRETGDAPGGGGGRGGCVDEPDIILSRCEQAGPMDNKREEMQRGVRVQLGDVRIGDQVFEVTRRRGAAGSTVCINQGGAYRICPGLPSRHNFL